MPSLILVKALPKFDCNYSGAPIIDLRGALDQLTTPMSERCTCNPPYALMPRFVIKLRDKFDTIIVIIIIIIISIINAFTNALS
jgi:hypothetical protein